MKFSNDLRIFIYKILQKFIYAIRIRSKILFSAFFLGLFINSYSIYGDYTSIAPNGTTKHLWSAMILILPLLISFLLILLGFIGFVLGRRKNFLTLFLVSTLYFFSFVICVKIGGSIRMKGFSKLAERSETLVNAIKYYDEKYGKPPEKLSNLVPEFIPEVPTTGIGAYPKYEYYAGETARDYYDNNPWALVVFTPPGGIGFDQFMYLPMQNYPEKGYGGVLKRVGDWAYVFE